MTKTRFFRNAINKVPESKLFLSVYRIDAVQLKISVILSLRN